MSDSSFSRHPFEDFYSLPSRNGVAPPKASRGAGVPMVSMGDLFSCPRIRDRKMERVPLGSLELERAALQPGDLLFARRSLKWSGAGVCSIFLGSKEPTTFESSLIRVRLDRDKAYPDFFFYLFRSPVGRRVIETIIEQTAVAGIKSSELAKLMLVTPAVEEQRRIASIFCTLDDKIDSSRQVARTLEACVSEVFRHRFLISGLAGDAFRQGVLSDIVQLHTERCRTSETTASLPYVPIDAISTRSLMLEDKRSGDQAQSSLTMFDAGDILFGAMRPYFHKVAIAPFRGVTRTTVFVIRPINDLDWAFATLLLIQPETIEFATRTARGSTIPYAVWKGVLSEMPVNIPPPEERAAFDRFARPALRFIQNACFEQDTLAEIRDTLLPKLISGEIRVPDTRDPEEVIGPAAEELAAAIS